MVNGYVINLFTYAILNQIVIQSYYLRVLTFILGLTLASLSLGAILSLQIIRFPLESLCIVLSQKLIAAQQRFVCILIFFLISTLSITIIFDRTLYIREGTVISFFLLSKLMGFSYDYCKKHM
jgi:uncharacterized membrane protein YczE